MGLLSSIADFFRVTMSPPPGFEQRDWLSDDDDLYAGTQTWSGTRVTRASSIQLSAVWSCIRLLSNTIATLPTDIIVSIGPARFPEFTKPSWLVSPFPGDPTMTPTEHFAQVATSLLLDGNFFTYVPNSVLQPDVLIVLDPQRVEVRRTAGLQPVYDILDDMGRVKDTVDSMKMLHGTWLRMPGAMRGISPIEAARQTIGLGLTTDEYAARFFGQGSTIPFGIEVPGMLTDTQKEELRESIRKSHASVAKSHNVGVLTGGAKFVSNLSVSNDQAQFLESRKFTVEEIARIYGIPPHMLGSQEPGASSYNSVEIRGQEFKQYAVLPLARRIEDPYQRLVEVPSGLRNSNATATFRFNLDAVARADSQARAETYKSLVTSGVLTPDEARALEDLPPIEGGDKAYMQQQMVPLGTMPVQPAAPAAPASAPPAERAIELHNHINADAVRVAAPVVPAPIVNVAAPIVNVPPAAAPIVNVSVPEEQTVEKRVVRDERGRIVALHEKRGRSVQRVEVET